MDEKRKHLIYDIANAVIHGIGTALSIAALVLLVVFSAIYHDAWYIVSTAIYGATLIILYISSTLYHSFQNKKVKSIFKIFDHSSIYLLIAGTYTPFTLIPLRGPWGWSIFGVIWGLAIGGIVFKTFSAGKFKLVSTLIYIAMGWLIIIAFKPIVFSIPTYGFVWLLVGGLFYTTGTIFYMAKKFPFSHAIWHMFVLAGSICHFLSIFYFIVMKR